MFYNRELFGEANVGQNYGLVYGFYTIFSVLNIFILVDLGVAFDVASWSMGGLTFLGFIVLHFFTYHAHLYNKKIPLIID
jgi:hypothetical protein